MDLSFIIPLLLGIIFAFLILYIFREDVKKGRYLSSGGSEFGEGGHSLSFTPLLVSDFDNIPNAVKLVEKYSRDPDTRIGAIEVINEHFDKIPTAREIIKRLSYDKSPTVKYHVVEVIDKHFDKIPNVVEIIERISSDKDSDVRYRIVDIMDRHFDKIPNAEEIVERLSQDKDSNIITNVAKVIKHHFDKIPDAGKIFAKLYESYGYGKTDENTNLLLIEILRDHFNKIPKAPEIFVNVLNTVIGTSTSEDDEIIFQSVIRIFSEHFYEIPDAKKLLEIFIGVVNKKEYLRELCKQQHFKSFFANIPDGIEILKKNNIL